MTPSTRRPQTAGGSRPHTNTTGDTWLMGDVTKEAVQTSGGRTGKSSNWLEESETKSDWLLDNDKKDDSASFSKKEKGTKEETDWLGRPLKTAATGRPTIDNDKKFLSPKKEDRFPEKETNNAKQPTRKDISDSIGADWLLSPQAAKVISQEDDWLSGHIKEAPKTSEIQKKDNDLLSSLQSSSNRQREWLPGKTTSFEKPVAGPFEQVKTKISAEQPLSSKDPLLSSSLLPAQKLTEQMMKMQNQTASESPQRSVKEHSRVREKGNRQDPTSLLSKPSSHTSLTEEPSGQLHSMSHQQQLLHSQQLTLDDTSLQQSLRTVELDELHRKVMCLSITSKRF